MTLKTSTIEAVYNLKLITDEQLDAAVTDYLNDPTPGLHELAEGVVIDVSAIMLANPYAREVLADPNASEAQMRMAVRTAILLARPVPDTRCSRGGVNATRSLTP